MIPKNFTKDNIEKLTTLYVNSSKEEILVNFPNYSWRNLQNIANKLKLKREFSERRNGKIEKLFNGSFESYYWLGLIVTDGYISKDGELKIELAVKDYEYLSRLSKFLETNINIFPPYKSSKPNSNGTCRVKIKDIKNGVNLRELLKIEFKKTYSSVNIAFIETKDNLVSFLGGYIDGDGTISKNGDIKIDAHKNHEKFMIYFGDKLKCENIISDYTITKYKDMVRLSFPRKDSVIIKKILISLDLPIMKRKWDRISNDYQNKENFLNKNKTTIFMLKSEGKTLKQICEILNYKSIGNLSCFIRKNKVNL